MFQHVSTIRGMWWISQHSQYHQTHQRSPGRLALMEANITMIKISSPKQMAAHPLRVAKRNTTNGEEQQLPTYIYVYICIYICIYIYSRLL